MKVVFVYRVCVRMAASAAKGPNGEDPSSNGDAVHSRSTVVFLGRWIADYSAIVWKKSVRCFRR